jgi:prepilin-type N-terminal cleavage/methylation domain-containing protein
MQRKQLLNQNGFSLPEILVALGIFAMLSLGVAMSVSQLFMMQKQISTNDVGDNFSAAFFQHMNVPYNCAQAVQGRQLPTGTNDIDLNVTTFRGLSPTSPVGVKAGTEVDRGLTVNRIFARQKAGVSQGVQVQVGASPTNDLYQRYTLQFVLRLERLDAKGKAHTLPDRVLEVPVLTRPSSPNIISTCMIESGAEDACLTLGGKYVNGLCTFPAECKVQGTFIKTSCSNPNVTCAPEYTGPDRNNAVTGGANCPAGSCPTQSGRFSISRSVQTGKKSWSTITVVENFYICMSCPGKPCP